MSEYLRAESRPVYWREMYATQQDAFRTVTKMLKEAVERLPPPRLASPPSAFTRFVRETRSSQIAFLFGGRGTGKTTVLWSLYKACDPALSVEQLRKYADALAGTVQEIRQRIIWLEPLDMEVLTPSSNLLAAILARIEDASQRLAMHEGLSASDQTLRGWNQYPVDPFLALQKLQTNIALAWEGDLRGRRHLLNPDDLALEVMRYEKAHLSLTQNLDSVLHQLAALPFTGGTISNPLFVLPVDDFDLNPPACLDLLRVLRMLALPRLFFLVLGDLDVANVLLNLKLSAELGRVAEAAEASRMLSLPAADVAAMAGEVAANAIRKLIPPAQRIQLAVPSLLEALNFRPLGYRDEDPYLHELLAQCPTYVFQSSQRNLQRGRRTHEGDLRKMLLAAGGQLLDRGGKQESLPDHAPLGERHLLHACYTARRLMSAPSRQVSDLWYGLKRLVESAPRASCAAEPENVPREDSQDESPDTAPEQVVTTEADDRFQEALRNFWAEQCRNELAEEPSLTLDERRSMPQAFHPRPYQDWDLTRLPLRAETVESPAIEISGASDKPDAPWAEYSLQKIEDWRLMVDTATGRGTSPTAGTAGSGRTLSSQAAATVILFHDLIVIGPWTPQRGSLLYGRDDFSQRWAVTRWRTSLKQAELPWPAPPCSSFYSLDRFRYAWNDFLRSGSELLDDPTVGPVVAACAWIAAGTEATRERSEESRPLITRGSKWWRKAWEATIDDLIPLIGDGSDRSYRAIRRREWLARVAMFLAPELGIIDLLEGWRAPKELENFWKKEAKPAILRRRAFWLANLHHEGMADLAQKLHRDSMPLSTPTALRPVKGDYLTWAKNLKSQELEIREEEEERRGSGPSSAKTASVSDGTAPVVRNSGASQKST
jgi:hypothetical protein